MDFKKEIEDHWRSSTRDYNRYPSIDYSEERLATFAKGIGRHSLQSDTYLQFTDLYFLNEEYSFISLEGLVNLIDNVLVKIYTGKKNLLDLGGVFTRSIYSFNKSDDLSLEKDIHSNGTPPILLYNFPKTEKMIGNLEHKCQYAVLIWVIHKRQQHLVSMSEGNKFKRHLSEFQKEFKRDASRFLQSRGIDPAVYEEAIVDIDKAYQECLRQTQNADTMKLAFDYHEIVAAVYFKLRILDFSHSEISKWLPNYFYTLVNNQWNEIVAATEIELEDKSQHYVNDTIVNVINLIDKKKVKNISITIDSQRKYFKTTKSVGTHLGYFNHEKGFNNEKLTEVTYPKLAQLLPKHASAIEDQINKFVTTPKAYLK